MTKIKRERILRPVWHESEYAYQGRPVCVAETPHNLLIRLKGTRMVLELPWAVAFLRASSIRASTDTLNRINARRARRKAKAGG